MPIAVKPSMSPDRELDLTGVLTTAIAHELWKQFGGNEIVNWLEAERIVASLTVNTRTSVAGRAAERDAVRRRIMGRPERVSGPIPNL